MGTDQESDSDLAVINYLFIYLFTISTPDLRPDLRQDLSIIPGRIMRLFQQVFVYLILEHLIHICSEKNN